jgi:hypothetical protein
MRKGQRIRLRRSSRAAQEWQLPLEAEGTVLCHYQSLNGRPGARECLDVRFGAGRVVWGVPATEFEVVAETTRAGAQGR